MANGKRKGTPGQAVDAAGWAVRDPTENVIALQAAAVARQDDLREMAYDHTREIRLLTERYEDKLREAESKRIDAIRAVDVAAVQRAAEVAAEAVQTLAAQVPITAEAVRTSLTAALDPILKDVSELRRLQYEQQGQRAGVVETKDTAAELASVLAPMAAEIQKLSAAQERNVGGRAAKVETTATQRYNVGQIYATVGVVGVLAGLVGHFLK